MINDILHDIQIKLKAPKSQYNDSSKYYYRNAEDILEAVKPLLTPHKATVTLTDEMMCVGDRIYVKSTAILRAGNENLQVCAYAREEETKKGMDAAQITGSASSYARKYALNGLFAIDDTKNADDLDDTEKNEKLNPLTCEKCGDKITKVKNNGVEWTAKQFSDFSYQQTGHFYCAACFNKLKNGN